VRNVEPRSKINQPVPVLVVSYARIAVNAKKVVVVVARGMAKHAISKNRFLEISRVQKNQIFHPRGGIFALFSYKRLFFYSDRW
jgi:hypothetical protein